MTQTEFVQHLIRKLKEASLIHYDKNFLHFISITDDAVHIKRLSGYMHRKGGIRDQAFLKAVEKKFNFHANIWNLCDSSQIARINESIEAIKMQETFPKLEALDLSVFIPIEYPINPTQKEILLRFQSLASHKALEENIDTLLKTGMLNKRIENQEFLVALIKLAYKKGLYAITVEFLLPNLFISYRQRTEIQKIEAHSRGSLGEHDEAKHILYRLVHENTIENINLKTSALSNHKRALLLKNRPIQKEDITLLIEGYKNLHAMEGVFSYYTGINLLYMVKLAQLIFPEEKFFFEIDAKAIYERSKPSLKQDNTHEKYYRTMGELEFKLLLEYKGVLKEIEFFLDDTQPHVSLVERTARQMKLFLKHALVTQHPLCSTFQKTIGLLESYCRYRSA